MNNSNDTQPRPSALYQLEAEVTREDPVFDRMLKSLQTNTPIVYSKINHNFWERLVFLDRAGVSYLEDDPEKARATDALRGAIGRPPKALVETGFVAELLELMQNMPLDDDSFIFCPGLDAMPDGHRLQGIPLEKLSLCEDKIAEHVPFSPHAGDGLEFKRALVNGRFSDFATSLKEKRFLLVANADLAKFPEFIGASDCEFIEIHGSEARYNREGILKQIQDWTEQSEENKCVVVQAGGALATWLAARLYATDRSLTFLDIGNALCICNPAAVFGRIFGALYRPRILSVMNAIHPGWFEKNSETVAVFGDTTTIDSTLCKTGRSEALVALAQQDGVRRPRTDWSPAVKVGSPVDFIENKPADPNRIADFLTLSSTSNHYANFGPVTRLVEKAIHKMLELPDDRVVVACSSCTAGLQVAAGIAAMALGHHPKWVASAFSFFTSGIGHYSNITMTDCSPFGGTDLDLVNAMGAEEWDAILFTNTFAQCKKDWGALRKTVRAQNKFLVVDNALGLLDRPKSPGLDAEIEVISLHHTKPWGFGEGGVMILPKAQESIARSFINFAADNPTLDPTYATNAKMSDLSAAAILDRLERLNHWRVFYRAQANRICRIIEKSDLELTKLPAAFSAMSPTGNVQFLAPFPVPAECLANDKMVLRKYYRPIGKRETGITDRFPIAWDLYDRMLCIPCHPHIRTLSEAEITDTLKGILERAQTYKE
jgi:dTDP-4-amino-4,6-dideoxygalactose transaminase